MNDVIETLREDLALQQKKLNDLQAWEDDPILIEAQNAVISELEKKIEAMQGESVK